VRRVMQANRSFGTTSETSLCNSLRRLGLRFRQHANVDSSLRCRADIVFRQVGVCVFVDGCYWHGCPKHFHAPKINSAWWNEKIADNRERDRRKTRALRKIGWTVMRIWEHELRSRGADRVARRVFNIVCRKKRAPSCGH
jgi:DNA mismatch endonuclease (patch repair protein)